MNPATDDRDLSARVAAAELRLLQHRGALAVRAGTLEARLRARITSPTALLTAGGVGFALEQISHDRSRPLLYLFNTLTHGSFVIWSLLSARAGAEDA